jgi:hypothetical protein
MPPCGLCRLPLVSALTTMLAALHRSGYGFFGQRQLFWGV